MDDIFGQRNEIYFYVMVASFLSRFLFIHVLKKDFNKIESIVSILYILTFKHTKLLIILNIGFLLMYLDIPPLQRFYITASLSTIQQDELF